MDAIIQGRVMVVIFSSHSNQSQQVIREVERAVSKGLAILPLRIEDVPLSKDMEYFISTRHWLDALTPPMEKHLNHLADTVNLLLSRTPPATKAESLAEDRKPSSGQPPPEPKKRLPAMRLAIVLALLVAVVVGGWTLLTSRHSKTEPLEVLPLAAPDEIIKLKVAADAVWERVKSLDRDQGFGARLDQAQQEQSLAVEYDSRRVYGQAAPAYRKFISTCQQLEQRQLLRQQVLAARQKAEQQRQLTESAFQTALRPASFEKGKREVEDADNASRNGQFETAKKLLADATELFATARAEADKINTMAEAQQAWSATLAAVDGDLLNKHVASQFQAAKSKAAEAQAKGSTALLTDATAALKAAVAEARTKENAAKALPVIARLETAVAGRDKFGAEDVLAELEQLIPSDPKMAGLRDKVAALPGPKKKLVVDLGGGVTMEFVLIRPGSFLMGSEKGNPNEKPTHKVTIAKPFYLGKYEVTQEQWQAVMGSNPSHFKGPKNPVEQVSWEDCQTFLQKLQEKAPSHTFRLPTEAEWEYACRAGSTTEFCYGDDWGGLGEYAWYGPNSGSTTHAVGEKKPNAWGLNDIHGNVCEWCQDWIGAYESGSVSDPVGPSSGSGRLLRGGALYNTPTGCRAAVRYYSDPSLRYDSFGLRVVVVAR